MEKELKKIAPKFVGKEKLRPALSYIWVNNNNVAYVTNAHALLKYRLSEPLESGWYNVKGEKIKEDYYPSFDNPFKTFEGIADKKNITINFVDLPKTFDNPFICVNNDNIPKIHIEFKTAKAIADVIGKKEYNGIFAHEDDNNYLVQKLLLLQTEKFDVLWAVAYDQKPY